MDITTSTNTKKAALLGIGTALLISAGPNLWLARRRADAESALRHAHANEVPATPQTQGSNPVPEPSGSPASDAAASPSKADPAAKSSGKSKDLSALFTEEMQTMMVGWCDWRSWGEASYLKMVTGASAPVVDAYQALLANNLKSGMNASDDKVKNGKELRKEEEDWLRQNLSPAEWAAWQQNLENRKAADLEAMAEESLYAVSKWVNLTPAQKEKLYALAVSESKKAFEAEWSRSVQFGVGISTNEPVQPVEWYDETIREVLTPEQWEVWEPATMHTRSLPDQLSGGMAARLVEAVREHDLAELLGQKFKELSAGMEETIKDNKATPDTSESK